MEPKPFDLEKAKRLEPIQARSGRKLTFLLHAPQLVGFQRVLVFNSSGMIETRTENGTAPESCDDLVMAPKKRTVTVRLYQHKLNRVEAAWVNSHPAVLQDWTLLQEWTKEVPE